MQRIIAIGDVHGCLEELLMLLEACKHMSEDRLLFLGDLIDRGPDPVGVVNFARTLGAESILGNHCEKHIRWARWEAKVKRGEASKNPMRPFPAQRLDEHRRLVSSGCLGWLAERPYYVRVVPNWLAVHAGLEPDKPIEEQHPNALIRCRYIKPNGRQHDRIDPDDDCRPWQQAWQGPDSVVYGHNVQSLTEVAITDVETTSGRVRTVGLDTGCCFGGRLSAAIFHDDVLHDIVQVQAKQAYAEWRGLQAAYEE